MVKTNILYEKSDRIAQVTISRPEANNALNESILLELERIVNELEKDDDVYSIIFTGAGNKAFIAGADIGELKDMSVFEARAFSSLGQRIYRKIEMLEKPTIAAVNGYALGGGCELALACDIRIASENAAFGLPEVTLGITPGWGGTQRLSKYVGIGVAKMMIYTGEIIKSEEALRIGLVNRVVPLEELLQNARSLADRILKNPPIAISYSKAAINRGMRCDMDTALNYEIELFSQCFASEDQKDAMQAFLEKRKVTQYKKR